MKEKKLKMSNRVFRRIMIPIMAIFTALICVANFCANYYSMTLDTYVGRGERITSTSDNIESAEYYTQKYETTEESRAAGAEVTKSIADEGIVLMKNDGVLPLDSASNVTPFGYRYIEPCYGGSGSGGMDTSEDYIVTPEEALSNNFTGTINNEVVAAMKAAEPEYTIPLRGASGGEDNYSGSVTALFEYNADIYKGTEQSCKDTTGIVFLARTGGEGGDLDPTKYEDGTSHQLALTEDEKNMIVFAEENCSNIVVVVESSNVMEIGELKNDEKVNAILWVGGLGSTGFQALADILTGDVVPSGKTVDIYPADLTKDPSYANYDDETDNFMYTNTNTYFHEYEEGIYVGYRYYETADTEAKAGNYEGFNYDDAVVYPFGYGLSYTTFSQEIIDFQEKDDQITVTVNVTNTGDTYAGKEVVQLYYEAPYTDYDKENGIEKASVNLIAYGKTGILQPGESEEVTLTFMKEDMASYNDIRDNGDGTTGCYMLENGDYNITLRSDSHTVIDTRTITVEDTIWYDNSNPRQSEINAQSALDEDGNSLGYPAAAEADADAKYVAATNEFESGTTYMTDATVSNATVMSRTDFKNTFPTAPTDEDREASAQTKEWIDANTEGNFDVETDAELGNTEGSKIYAEEAPVSNADNGLTLADLRGKSYYDPEWDLLLDQLDYSNKDELQDALFMGGYTTGEIEEIGKPVTADHDGPQGITQNDNDATNWVANTCAYTSETTLAASWNTELSYAFGAAVGQECLTAENNGWYAPGLNIHRSAFGGRNFEYFSEDPVLSGTMGSAEVSGAGDNGVYCTMKHFLLNDQEAHRSGHLNVWATEQTYREIYLKSFELAVKNATKTIQYVREDGSLTSKTMRAADGLMAAFAAIGKDWVATSYELMTNVVSDEWGFQGLVITDMAIGTSSDFADKLIRAGTDVLMQVPLNIPGMELSGAADYSSATGQTAMRKAIKDLCYTVVNSNVMQGVAPGTSVRYAMSPWKKILIAVDIVAVMLVIAGIAWIIWRNKDEKKNPDKYKSLIQIKIKNE